MCVVNPVRSFTEIFFVRPQKRVALENTHILYAASAESETHKILRRVRAPTKNFSEN